MVVFPRKSGDKFLLDGEEFVYEIDGPIKVDVTGADTSEFPEIYFVDNYSLKREIIGVENGITSVNLLRNNTLVIANISVSPTSIDELKFSGDELAIEFISGNGTSSVTLLLDEERDNFAHIAAIEVQSLQQGDAVGLEFDKALNSVTINNTGLENQFTLTLEQVGTYSGEFENIEIALEANSSAIVTPENWTDLTHTTIEIQHDTGNDGYIDWVEHAYMRGDLNGNRVIDWGDVVMCAYMSWELILQEPDVADFNDNGIVDWGDVVKLAYYHWELIPEL